LYESIILLDLEQSSLLMDIEKEGCVDHILRIASKATV
jgi:hypothetical protein